MQSIEMIYMDKRYYRSNYNKIKDMKSKVIKISIFFALTVISTIGMKIASDKPNNTIGLAFANMEAMASDSEGGGPIIDPNIAYRHKLEFLRDDSGGETRICCVRANPDDECNYKHQKNCR